MQATEAASVTIPFNIYVAFYLVVRQQHQHVVVELPE